MILKFELEEIMWALYGIAIERFQSEIGGPFEETSVRSLVALFSTYKLACDYVKSSQLKTYLEKDPNVHDFPFRRGSVLRAYHDFEIEEYQEIDVPIDPIL